MFRRRSRWSISSPTSVTALLLFLVLFGRRSGRSSQKPCSCRSFCNRRFFVSAGVCQVVPFKPHLCNRRRRPEGVHHHGHPPHPPAPHPRWRSASRPGRDAARGAIAGEPINSNLNQFIHKTCLQNQNLQTIPTNAQSSRKSICPGTTEL